LIIYEAFIREALMDDYGQRSLQINLITEITTVEESIIKKVTYWCLHVDRIPNSHKRYTIHAYAKYS